MGSSLPLQFHAARSIDGDFSLDPIVMPLLIVMVM